MRTKLLLALSVWLCACTVQAQLPNPYRDQGSAMWRPNRLPGIESPAPPAGPMIDETAPGELLDDPLMEDPAAVLDQPWYSYWTTSWTEWDGSFELGLNGTDGNSEAFSLRFGGKLKRETDFSSHKFEVLYNDQSNNGINTARNLLGRARIEWPLADTPWSLYVHTFGEYDDFKQFDFRLSGDAGLQYAFVQTDVSKIKGSFGGSASREWGSADDDVKPEIALGLDWERKLSDRQKASLEVDYYPSVQDFSDARINSSASWEVVVDPTWGLSLKLSLIDRYDTTPAGAKHNDINYAVLMLWSF